MVKFIRDLDYDIITNAKNVLNIEKSKANGTYNLPEVLEALNIIFSRKCYICENKNTISSYQIEHLKAHKEDKELKFCWDNLYLSCTHCNNIKLDLYDNILDCIKIDIDKIISFRIKGDLFIWNVIIEIEPLQTSDDVNATVELLNKVYNGNTPQKELESINIKNDLIKEVGKFVQYINEYYQAIGLDKEDTKALIVRELKASSPFTAFKRWLIRDNKDKLNEFFQYLN